jgi:hypothetical protein
MEWNGRPELAFSKVRHVPRNIGRKGSQMSSSKVGSQSMFDPKIARPVAPPLAPVAIHDILRDADALLALMGKETLGVVAELARSLAVSAHEAEAWEIEAAAGNVRRLASSGGPVVLAGAMRALTDAIARTENAHAA